jgi:7-cyano-7-deazaguanine synthase
MTGRALVLFSGGQDSATCLAWALDAFGEVETIGFTYGQRHDVELRQRQVLRERIAERFALWAPKLGPDHLVDLGFLSALGATAMTEEMEIELGERGLPNTFVPGRNLAFLVAAGALAYRREQDTLVGGMCETDYSGYPDCRREAIDAQEKALALGMDHPLTIATPLMQLTKAESWKLAERLGGSTLVDLIIEESHTCYLGKRETRHEWGYGCGSCPACELRAEGYRQYREESL